jgi:hypothetical protein
MSGPKSPKGGWLCGLCLPTCPIYDATKLERNGPCGRFLFIEPDALAATVQEPSRFTSLDLDLFVDQDGSCHSTNGSLGDLMCFRNQAH